MGKRRSRKERALNLRRRVLQQRLHRHLLRRRRMMHQRLHGDLLCRRRWRREQCPRRRSLRRHVPDVLVVVEG